ncbi:MAG: DUF6445 family protein [Pseudomonadota bacterium]
MIPSFMVIDDFLENAEDLRAMAKTMDFPELEVDTAYPGRNSVQRINIPGLEDQVSRLVHTPLKPKAGSGHARFRLTLAGDEGIADIHIDDSHWSGIYFLSRPEDCMGGTEFYRHLPTGTDRALTEPEDIHKLGASSRQEANQIFNDILLNDSKDRSKWEKIMDIPMQFNRLILFRPWFWHTAGPGFGHDFDSGRLVYLLFFDQA